MNETTNPRVCERADDLVSFLYGELSDSEARSFEQHRQTCLTCESELAAFGPIRRSILNWRDRSLGKVSGFAATVPTRKRSAMAAIREFFDLSPLWMRGATALAAVLFCVLLGLTLTRRSEEPQPPAQPGRLYTAEEFKAAVEKETAQQLAVREKQKEQNIVVGEKNAAPAPRQRPATSRQQFTVSSNTPRRIGKPLTRAEREQLAADLRLISEEDDDSLELLGDRINR